MKREETEREARKRMAELGTWEGDERMDEYEDEYTSVCVCLVEL